MRSWLLLLGGCADLDSFVFNPVHCSTVGPETCEDADSPWDAICVPCDEPYDFERDYDWMPGTLSDGQTVRPIPAELVSRVPVPTEDGEGELDAYFLAAHGDDPAAAAITVVYNHGNYAGLEHYLPRLRFLHEAGYNVFAWDYRGYGKSEPDTTPTAEQHLADAHTVLARAAELAPDPAKLVVYGYSLGAVTATEMALEAPGCGLLLEAPFTSIAAITENNTTLSLGEGYFSTGRWDNFARMEAYDGPVLGMSGTADDLFATDEVAALVAAGGGPSETWRLPGVYHGISDGGVPEAGLGPYLDHVSGHLAGAGCR